MASFNTESNHDYNANSGNDYDRITKPLYHMAWRASGLVRNLINAIKTWRASSTASVDRW